MKKGSFETTPKDKNERVSPLIRHNCPSNRN